MRETTRTEYQVVNVTDGIPSSTTDDELQAWARWQALRGEYPDKEWRVESRTVTITTTEWEPAEESVRPPLGETKPSMA